MLINDQSRTLFSLCDVLKGRPRGRGGGEGNFEQCDLHESNTWPHPLLPFRCKRRWIDSGREGGGGVCGGEGEKRVCPRIGSSCFVHQLVTKASLIPQYPISLQRVYYPILAPE